MMPAMEPNVTALERVFELARSGECATISDVRNRLRAEGYDCGTIEGPHLIRQLRRLCGAATHLSPEQPSVSGAKRTA